MNSVNRVLIAGAGIGGLALAIALARREVEVDVVEIREEASALGVGIIQHCNAMRVLQSLGLLEACHAAGFQTDERRYHDEQGEIIVSANALRSLSPSIPAYNSIPRPALHRILVEKANAAGARIRLGDTLAALAQEEGTAGVDVRFESGIEARYDLVVGADGIRSKVRQLAFDDAAAPRFTGFGFWRVTLPRLPHLDFMGMYHGVNATKAGLVPLTQASMYLFLASNEGELPRLDAKTRLAMLRTRLDSYGGDVGAVRDGLTEQDEIVYSPAEQMELPSPWFRGRVVLIGDAAHAGLPHLAQGSAMALEDAWVLDELIGGGAPIGAALERFMARRYERCLYVQKLSLSVAESEQRYDAGALQQRREHLRDTLPAMWRASDAKLGQLP